jgi:septum formation protein
VSAVRVVLASASPRRRDLLNLIGIPHEVRPANIDEAQRPREAPRRHVERLAREKAGVVATRDPDLITIGADTVVVINRKVLGKPANTQEAAHMLGLLSGREHTVITAVAVSRGKKLRSAIEEVRVKFAD